MKKIRKLEKEKELREAEEKAKIKLKKLLSQYNTITIPKIASKLNYKAKFIKPIIKKMIQDGEIEFRLFDKTMIYIGKKNKIPRKKVKTEEKKVSEAKAKWECSHCHAPISKEQGQKLLNNEIAVCKFCGKILN